MIYTQVVPASHLTPACHPPCPPRSWPFPRTTQWPWGGVMDVPADQSARAVAQRIPPGTVRRARRRRPTGEAPPLPYHLQTSGVRWLIAGVVLVGLSILIFARGLRGVAVEVTVVDDAVVGWLVGLDAPGLVGVWRVLAAISSWWVL